mmetsp:Transcript_106688/g.299768  ORF Transcript_106688/g.299768 Transcript_106688/m.299768 type:complete len:414 (-) Transcript_106688:175-1416(-)
MSFDTAPSRMLGPPSYASGAPAPSPLSCPSDAMGEASTAIDRSAVVGSAGIAQCAGAQPPAEVELSCCDYVSASGEVRSVLQFFCECNEADVFFDEIFRGQGADLDRFDRAVRDVDDRVRVPWPFGDGGALHLGLPGLLPPLILCPAAVLASRSFAGLVVTVVGMPLFAYSAHQRLMRLRRRNAFFLSWTLHSLGLGACAYMICFLDAIPPEANVFEVALAGTALVSLASAMAGPVTICAGADASTLAESRAHRCAMTGAVVAGYDHYCTWVGSSVGWGNHRAYLCFVVAVLATCVSVSICVSIHIGLCRLPTSNGETMSFGPKGALASLVACAYANESSFALAFVAYLQIVTIGVSALLMHQVSLISRGLTSYEKRHRLRIDYLWPRNPHDMGFLKNWGTFFRGSSARDRAR